MAVLPIHTAIQHPDIVGNFQRGLLFGQQQRAQRQAEQEKTQLRSLAPAIQGGDPAAYGQAAAISPEYANAQQEVGNGGLRRLQGAITFIEQAQKTGDARAVEAAYQQVRPYLSRFGKEAPATFAEAEPQFNQARAQIAMLNAQSGQPGGANKVVGGALVGPNGEVLYESPNKGQIVAVNDGAGGTVQMIFDPVTRSLSPLNAGQPGTIFTDANGERLDVSGVEDPVVRRQIMENPTAYGLVPDGGSARIPEQGRGLGYAPPKPDISPVDQQRLDIDRARLQLQQDEANRKANAPSPATQKTTAAQATKLPQVNNVERGLDRIETAMKGLEGGVVNTGPLDQYVVRNLPSGQELEAAIGGIQNSLLALTRVPGIGAQSDLEARIAALQYPSLDKAPEVNKRTLANLRQFVSDLKSQIEAAPSQTAQPATQRAVNPTTGEVLVLRNGQWVPE